MKPYYILALVGLCALGACKPNEEAYKSAYESAIAKRDADGGALEGTVYNRYREMAKPSEIAVGSDTLAVITEFIGYTENGGASRETTKRYNVVVGRFKQVFNARQMRERLQANGYPDVFILHTREPLYYVVTATCDTPEEALDELRRVKADSTLVLRDPLPFVLQPAHMAR